MKKNIISILIGVGLALIIIQFAQPVVVNGSSMHPYLENGDFLIMEKVNKHPDYNDVVVFKEGDYLLIKRVIGKPGDKIEFKDDGIYVNDKKRNEDFIVFETKPGADVTLNDNEYYVMGDNRQNSMDSREIGPINKHKIVGIAKLRLFPKPDSI